MRGYHVLVGLCNRNRNLCLEKFVVDIKFHVLIPDNWCDLQNVVHMFNDEDALEALQNCKKSLTPDGKLLIYDPILPSEFGGELLHGGGTDDGHSTAAVYRRGGSR